MKAYIVEIEFPYDGRRVATIKTTDKNFCEKYANKMLESDTHIKYIDLFENQG